MDKLWAQAYALSLDKSFVAELTREDIIENEKRNDKFQVLTIERESLNKYFEPSTKELGEHKTARDITQYIMSNSVIRINEIQLGKALSASGFERKKKNGVYGYYVTYKSLS